MAFSLLKQPMAALLCVSLSSGPVLTQDFSPRVYVNDRVITQFEFDQRLAFLRVLRSTGDLEAEALKGLIEDRLREFEAERLDLEVTPEELKAGMEEFAQRANLTSEQLIEQLAKVDIAEETLRDFVSAGILWRKAVRERFAGLVPITENDIDLALEAATRAGALRVLVSELVIPVPEGEDGQEQLARATELSQSLRGEGAFSDAAREFSAAPTAAEGGRLDWMPLANLPGPIASALLVLGPGEVSKPFAVPGAVILFMLRDLAEDRSAAPISVSVEWAEFLLPNDPVEIARVRSEVDVCYDLYGQAKGLPADRLTVTTQPASEIPGDVALELARLDPGESSVALMRGQFRRFLMLCSREEVREEPITREQVRERVVNQKVDGLTEAYLEELRSAAIIREP